MSRGAPASRPACRAARDDRGQRGAVLLLFVLLVVGLLGLAGLVLDLGLARVVQGRMEGAVEGAALEGLAWRDVPLGDDAATREVARRARARAVLLRAFDEDGRALDGLAAGSAPNTRLALGVGPDISVVPGDGVAGGLVSIASTAVVPDPQLNLDNARHGDLVAGEFLPGIDPDTCAAMLGLPTGFPENAAYERCDFDAPDAAGAPGIAQRQPSFLARLRRTADPDGLDDLPGVSWRAPTLPYLLGRGAAIYGDGGAAANAGIALRGTALADARPALVASVPNGVDGGLALVPTDTNADGIGDTDGVLAIDVAAWASCFDGAAAVDVRFEPGGAVVVSTGSPCADGTVVGRVIAPGLVTPGLVAAGEPATILGAGLALDVTRALVALVAPVDGGGGPVDLVVGFGAVEISAPTAGGVAALRRLQGGDGEGLVVPRAASAVFVPARHPALDAPTLQALLSASASLPFAARAPVLVR